MVYVLRLLIHINNAARPVRNNIAHEIKKVTGIMIKKKRYIKILFLSSLLTIVFFSINSCEKQSIDFGSGFIDNTITNLVLVDTSTVEISTIQVDSAISSNTNTILTGKYKDEQFGKITAQSFVQLGIPTATYTIPDGSVFDSVEVVLKLNKTFYGDTLSSYNVSIHQLNDPIAYAPYQYSFYNTETRPYNATELGSKQLVIAPYSRDTIAIKLSQSLGMDLFGKLQSKDPAIMGNDQFISYFRGLAIVGGQNNNLIMGFSDSLTMRVHYHMPGVFTQSAVIMFGLKEANFQFNNIVCDRSGTTIANLSTSKSLPSSKTNNAGFAQYITGTMVKIRFPYLADLYQLPNFVKIVKAQLIVKPVQNSYLGYYRLPPYMRLSVTDQYNLLGANLAIATSATANTVQYGNLYIDNLYGTQTAYTYDVTSYLQSQIAIALNNKDGLLISPPNNTAIFNRLLIADGSNSTNKTQVKIYYAAIK